MVRLNKNLTVLLIIILFSWALLGKTLIPDKTEIIYGGDLLTQFYFWKGYLRENLLAGKIPFWNPYIFSGTPFLAHPGVAPFYPLTLIFLLLPLNFAFSVNYLIHIIIAGLGVYYLTKKSTGYISSIFASLLFIGSGYVSSRIYAGHLDLLTTSVWIPWIIYSLINQAEHPGHKKYIIHTSFFITLLILAGYSAYLLFTLGFITLFLMFLWFQSRSIKKSSEILPAFLGISLSVLFATGLSALSWLPTWQLTGNSIRGQGLPYSLASWGSLPVSGLKLFINPFDRTELDKISFNLGGGPKPNPFDHYSGRIAILVILGFVLLWVFRAVLRKKTKINPYFWLFLFASVIFLWISFGPNIFPSLHLLLFRFIPLYRYIRIPIQNLIFPVVLLPVMTAFVLSVIKNDLIKLIIGSVAVIELYIFSAPFIFLTSLPEMKHDQDLILSIKKETDAFLKPGSGGRLLPAARVISPLLQKFDLNASMNYRFGSTSGYDPVILRNYYDFIDAANTSRLSSLLLYNVEIPPLNLNPAILNFLNISRVLVDYPADDLSGLKLKSKTEYYSLFENTSYQEKFFPVSSLKIFNSDDSLKDEIISKLPDFSATVYISTKEINKLSSYDINCPDGNLTGEAEILEFDINKIRIKTSFNCPVFLSSSEVYYPGWKVKVNGKKSPVLNSNIAFRTVYLPMGENNIEYYFSPDIYILGFTISLTSLGFILIYYLKKPKPKQHPAVKL